MQRVLKGLRCSQTDHKSQSSELKEMEFRHRVGGSLKIQRDLGMVHNSKYIYLKCVRHQTVIDHMNLHIVHWSSKLLLIARYCTNYIAQYISNRIGPSKQFVTVFCTM